MRFTIVLLLLLFEPIVIDEAMYNQILQGAHANMRGMEYDLLAQILKQLEQQAVIEAAKKTAIPALPSGK